MYKIKGADQQEYGPATADQVRQWIAQRRANEHTLAQGEGSLEWKPLSAYPEFADALQQLIGLALPAPPGYPPPTPAVPVRKTNPMAFTGLVLGILSLTVGWLCCCGSPIAFFGIIFSALALHQIKNNPLAGSRNMALVGLALSILGFFVGVILPFLVRFGSQGKDVRRAFPW